jgi:hypothetical protein
MRLFDPAIVVQVGGGAASKQAVFDLSNSSSENVRVGIGE